MIFLEKAPPPLFTLQRIMNKDKATLTRIASLMGVSRQSLYNWRIEPGAPQPDKEGNYSLGEWLSWVQVNNKKGKGDVSEQELKNRRLLAQCKKLEAELLILQGKWIPRTAVARYMEDVFTSCRSKIIASTMDDISKDEILNELTRLKSAERVVASSDEIGQDVSSLETPAEVDGNGVGGEAPETF